MRSLFWKALLALAAAWSWNLALANPGYVGFELGTGFHHTDADTLNAVVAWRFQPDWLLGGGPTWEREMLLEADLGFWRRTDYGAVTSTGIPRPDGTVNEIGLTPVLRLAQIEGERRWFFELGLGLHALDGRGSFADKLGTDIEYGPLLGVGLRVGPHWELGYRLRHISNNDYAKPNTGLDFQLLRVAYYW